VVCQNCPYIQCVGSQCDLLNASLNDAKVEFDAAVKAVPHLAVFLPKDSLLNVPKIEVGKVEV
jgi:hypothetical protein